MPARRPGPWRPRRRRAARPAGSNGQASTSSQVLLRVDNGSWSANQEGGYRPGTSAVTAAPQGPGQTGAHARAGGGRPRGAGRDGGGRPAPGGHGGGRRVRRGGGAAADLGQRLRR